MSIAYPDVTGAMINHLKAATLLIAAAEVSDRIGDEVKQAWGFSAGKAKRAIVIDGPKGGPPSDQPPLLVWRYDLYTYGGNKLTANDVMMKVLGFLCPMNMIGEQFKQNGVFVSSITPETGPIALVDPDTKWSYTFCPLIVRFIAVAS